MSDNVLRDLGTLNLNDTVDWIFQCYSFIRWRGLISQSIKPVDGDDNNWDQFWLAPNIIVIHSTDYPSLIIRLCFWFPCCKELFGVGLYHQGKLNLFPWPAKSPCTWRNELDKEPPKSTSVPSVHSWTPWGSEITTSLSTLPLYPVSQHLAFL